MFTQSSNSTLSDSIDRVLRYARQDITRLVRECRNVIEYRRPAKYDFVFADYLECVRRFSEHCERHYALHGCGGSLTEPMAPLSIWKDDYRWDDVLARVAPTMARAA